MIDFVYLILSWGTLRCFNKRKYTTFIVLFFTLLSHAWGVLPPSQVIFNYDYVNLITAGTILIAYKRNKDLFSTRNDVTAKFLLILVSYYLLVSLFSPLRGVETLMNSLMVFRFDFFYLLYFVFRTIPSKSFIKAIPKLLKYTIFSGILYFLQFTGFSLYQEIESTGSEYSRFSNIPILTTFMFFYLFLTRDRLKFKFLGIAYFFAMIVLSQNRGMFISVCVCIMIFILFKRHLLQAKVVFTILLVVVMLSGVIIYRLSDSGSTGGGIREELDNVQYLLKHNDYVSYDSNSMYTEGTFFFRIAMILERVDYLAQNPIDLLFGAGAYHEMSESTRKLPFVLGSNAGEYRSKVDTDDVGLLSHFFRCGLLYILIYIIFLYKSCRFLWYRNDQWSQVCLLMLLSITVNAISGELFFRANSFCIVLLLLAYCHTMENCKYLSNKVVKNS